MRAAGNRHHTRPPGDTSMDWITQNEADAAMLQRFDLTPIDAAAVEADEQLVEAIAAHNAAAAALTERFARLAKERDAFATADNWFERNATHVLGESQRLTTESWDALVAMRKLLEARAILLRRIENYAAGKAHGLYEQLEQALHDARRSLERKHRKYLKDQPVIGAQYIAARAEDDAAVVALRDQAERWDAANAAMAAIRDHNRHTTPLTFRQRQVYEQMN
ncbi:MAG: hypothetical protein GC159_24190 [Phycisphaera sp.]|nr:hypothetical protein [Phycisphaera sp.]